MSSQVPISRGSIRRHDNDFDSLPRLNIMSDITNIPHLTLSDVDLNMPSDVNFNYHSPHELRNNEEILNCLSNDSIFSILHCNIRSLYTNKCMYILHCNIRSLYMVSKIDHPFSVIGLTETKLKENLDQLTVNDLRGYDFLSQPSLSNTGGVRFFTLNVLKYTVRSDLSSPIKDDFETLWVEFENKSYRNMICGVVYRHPNGNINCLVDHINKNIGIINEEHKYCAIMGDFNIDLLKFEPHPDTDNFLNYLSSFHFQPHILQPTRITDHSSL